MLGIMQDRPLLISSLDRARESMSPEFRDRLAHDRGPDPPLHLRRHCPPLEAGGEGADCARRQAGRPHRHAGVERLSPHGAVFRRVRHGRRAAHDQSAPVPGADRVHRQPCRGPVPVLRPHLCAADREAWPGDEDGEGVRGDDRPRAHAGAQDPEPAVLRGAGRGAGQRLRVAGVRRAHGVVAVLHVGHHRQPQGRALFAPLDGAALLERRARSTASGCRRPSRRCWSCRCSTSTPGACRTPARCAAPSW